MRFNKKWKKVLQPEKGKYGIYKKAGIVLLLSIVMFSAVYVTDNHRQLAQDENGNRILERKGQGEGKKTEKIQMETGEWKEKMKVQISEKKYAKEEIGEQLSKAAEELPDQILGENKSLDEVRSDLNLIMEIPHTGISVSWELDNYEVMNSRGVLKQEKLTEEGTLVKLTAVLRYDEEKMSCEFYAHLFSTPLSKKEGVLKKISQEVEKADQSDRSDALAYELEYILQGKGSDKENLESVLFRLFLLRISGNYGCLAKDMGRVAEAEALAVTISALLLMPEAVEALKQMILVAWAGGESVMDLRCLLDGRKVPLVKSADKWVVSLSQLPLLLTDGGSVRGNDSGEGVGYSDYIRMFLFLKSVPEITMRTLDCVEEALHSKHILFQADQCVTKLEIQNKIIVYKNLNYQYPVYFGYE